jgi:hypothetical protein
MRRVSRRSAQDAGFHRFNSVADYQESLLDRLFPRRAAGVNDAVPWRRAAAQAKQLQEAAIWPNTKVYSEASFEIRALLSAESRGAQRLMSVAKRQQPVLTSEAFLSLY